MRWAWLVLLAGCRFGGPSAGNAPGAPGVDAAVVEDAAGIAHADADGTDVADGTDLGTDVGAVAVDAAVCDPVYNTGCSALLRCDVGEGTLTGACVGIWVSGEGAACFKGSGTDSCAVRLTCFGGTCRALCYGDADCKAAHCCNVSLPSGFKVCSACP